MVFCTLNIALNTGPFCDDISEFGIRYAQQDTNFLNEIKKKENIVFVIYGVCFLNFLGSFFAGLHNGNILTVRHFLNLLFGFSYILKWRNL